jgi:hypothetical protein
VAWHSAGPGPLPGRHLGDLALLLEQQLEGELADLGGRLPVRALVAAGVMPARCRAVIALQDWSLVFVDVEDRAPSTSTKWLSKGNSSWFTHAGLIAMAASRTSALLQSRSADQRPSPSSPDGSGGAGGGHASRQLNHVMASRSDLERW